MSELELFEDSDLFPMEDKEARDKKKGPPNRINDLNYSQWMKYQKSFFRWTDNQDYIDQSMLFFTKQFPDTQPSQSIIFGFHEFQKPDTYGKRKVHHVLEIDDFANIEDNSISHAVIDATTISNELTSFNSKFFENLFSILEKKLKNSCYLQVLLGKVNGNDYPLAYQIAMLGGNYLRIRDERIAIHPDKQVSYSLIFQKDSEWSKTSFSFVPIKVSKAEVPKIEGWTIPKPPPRSKNEILHPAKYPETLIENFIEVLSKPNDLIFDPMSGTGSTQLAALKLNRRAFGFELMPEFAEIANKRIRINNSGSLFDDKVIEQDLILTVDATDEKAYELKPANFDYVVTSPPYWSMLRNSGSENQKNRRVKALKTHYSEDSRDIGNVESYKDFMNILIKLYELIGFNMHKGAFLTVVVKNVKRNHTVFPLAWDLVSGLAKSDGNFEFIGNTLWCQDDIGMKPFAVGTHWVSNTVHQYCLHFRKI